MEQGRIYVCDDEPELQQLLRRLLEGRGHAVETFGGGPQLLRALEEPKEERPDLVLLDMKLPGMDGLEVLRQIRVARPELPVVICLLYTSDAADE